MVEVTFGNKRFDRSKLEEALQGSFLGYAVIQRSEKGPERSEDSIHELFASKYSRCNLGG